MQWRAILCAILSVRTCAVWADLAFAHGFAGKRFFPATLVTDDPFVADELSLPTVSHIKNPASGDSPAFRETDYTVEISKRIAPNFGLSASETLIHLEPQGDSTQTGFGNLELGGKYQLFLSTPHETLLSLGLNAEIGGTGRKMVGADSFTTFTPAVFYGKGFGDLPDVVAALKPLALTGVLGVAIPTKAKSETVTSTGDVDVERHPNVLQWGFAIEYSLPYLQSFVKDIGLPKPLSQLIPIVELNFQTPLDRGQGGKTTGTVNPGVVNLLRALTTGTAACSLGPDLAPPRLVAPDFTFDTADGRQESLRDFRGRAAVLLVLYRLPGSRTRLEQLEAASAALAEAGVRVLAVAEDETTARTVTADVHRLVAGRDGSGEVAATYALLGPEPTTSTQTPLHLEFLIDRRGYLRARWRMGEEPGWGDAGSLLRAVDALRREAPGPPAPEDGHMH